MVANGLPNWSDLMVRLPLVKNRWKVVRAVARRNCGAHVMFALTMLLIVVGQDPSNICLMLEIEHRGASVWRVGSVSRILLSRRLMLKLKHRRA
jgi:hypothetical protein